MNDSKKILALILGSILGLGAVATVSRNLRSEDQDETPTMEQEVGFSDGYIVESNLAEKEIVAYLRFPAGWKSNQFATQSKGDLITVGDFTSDLESLVFTFNNLRSAIFDGCVLSEEGIVENRDVMNFYFENYEGSSAAVLVVAETCYVPVDLGFVIGATSSSTLDSVEWNDDGTLSIVPDQGNFSGLLSAGYFGAVNILPEFVFGVYGTYSDEMTLVKA